MIVDDFNDVGAVRRPEEANAKLPVDANSVLPASILLQGLQLIAWRDPKRREGDGRIKLIELATHHGPERVGTGAPRATRVDAVEDIRDKSPPSVKRALRRAPLAALMHDHSIRA